MVFYNNRSRVAQEDTCGVYLQARDLSKRQLGTILGRGVEAQGISYENGTAHGDDPRLLYLRAHMPALVLQLAYRQRTGPVDSQEHL